MRVGTTAAAEKGSDGGSDADSGHAATGAANITASWTLPGDEQIGTLAWVLTHPGDDSSRTQTGTVSVTSDPATFLISDLEPSAAYSLQVSGTSTDSATLCTNSSPVKIDPNRTVDVSIALPCMSALPDAGYVQITGSTVNCATLVSVSLLPSEVSVGSSVKAIASAAGPDPGAISYLWSAPSGLLAAPTSSSTSFTCTTTGIVPLTLQVADGPLPDGSVCDPTLSTAVVSVQCD